MLLHIQAENRTTKCEVGRGVAAGRAGVPRREYSGAMEPHEVARLEEERLAVGTAEISEHVRPVRGGGVACRDVPGAWNNLIVGVGMHGALPSDWGDELRSICGWYEDAGVEPRIEVAPFADMSLLRHCEAERFVVRNFDNVLYRVLQPGERVMTAQAPDPRIRVRPVKKDDDADVRAASRIAMTGSHPPGHEFEESDYALWAKIVKHPRTQTFVASVETPEGLVPAGAGSIELHGEIACLFGLSTLHAFRKLGIQQSLIAARLNLAIEQGVKVATIGSRPGAGTERNVRRMGFQTAYTKVILARSGPGLTPARG